MDKIESMMKEMKLIKRIGILGSALKPAPCTDHGQTGPCSADFQSAVSRISNPPALRSFNTCRLEVGDTADWKSALLPPCQIHFIPKPGGRFELCMAGAVTKFCSSLLVVFAFFLPVLAHAKLNVVVTTPDLASIAKEIGGEEIQLYTPAKTTPSPPFVASKPRFNVKL